MIFSRAAGLRAVYSFRLWRSELWGLEFSSFCLCCLFVLELLGVRVQLFFVFAALFVSVYLVAGPSGLCCLGI